MKKTVNPSFDLKSFLSSKLRKAPSFALPKSRIKEPRAKKTGKLPQWGLFKIAWDMLYNPQSSDYLDKDLRVLVAYKSYLSEPERSALPCPVPTLHPKSECHPAYILDYLGISIDQYEKDAKIKRKVDTINIHVDMAIWFFKHILRMVPWIIKKCPEAKLWAADIFGPSAWHYGIVQKRKSSNHPNYKKSYELFIRSIKGETYKQLGFTKYSRNTDRLHTAQRGDSRHYFDKRHRPQGALCFLYKIYDLLYGESEWRTHIIDTKKRQIKEICDTLPRDVYRTLLKQLYTEEFKK